MQENFESEAIRQFKRKVRRLHKMLKVLIPSLKLGHCFNYLARLYGASGWNMMRAVLNGQNHLEDNISPNLDKKALQLYSIRQIHSENVTVDDCYECLLPGRRYGGQNPVKERTLCEDANFNN